MKTILSRIINRFKPKLKVSITVCSSRNLLTGRRILITGGGRGIGFYIAKRCIAEGGEIIITGRNVEHLKEASKKLNDCPYIPFDITDIGHFDKLLDKCEKIYDTGIDCLVNNAGISLHEGSIQNETVDTWNKQFSTNLAAPYFLTQEYLRRYDKFGKTRGNILFITSERGLYGDDIPYGLIKAALNSLTAGLGRRLLKKGIYVNAIAPGVTASDMTGYSKNGNLYRQAACAKRVYLPEEVAEVAVFMLSDLSNCISSQIIPCNNGNHLRCDW